MIILKKENLKEYDTNSPQISDHPYGILTIRDSGSGKKTSLLFDLINQQQDIDKTYLYVKDPFEAKYKFLIKKEKVQA